MDNIKSINQSIAAYRRYRCMPRPRLSKEIGVDINVYMRWERRGDIPLEMIEKIAEFLEVDASKILNLEPPPKKMERLKKKYLNVLDVNPIQSELALIVQMRELNSEDRNEILNLAAQKYEAEMKSRG